MTDENNPFFLMGAMLGEKSGEVADLRRRIEKLETKLAQVTAAYRIEVMQRGPWVSHEDFDRHIREITGDHDE